MTRYVGTGAGEWRGDWYRYVPSTLDRVTAREVADAIAARVTAKGRRRNGYGAAREARPDWYVRGFLGEVAALHAIGSGPDLDAWNGAGWYRSPDWGTRTEVRTTSTRQLYGFAARPDRYPAGLAGWPVFAKDAGRVILCVCERPDGSFVVYGYAEADAIARLDVPEGGILAVIEPNDLGSFRAIIATATT